jgi:hypothetical protein
VVSRYGNTLQVQSDTLATGLVEALVYLQGSEAGIDHVVVSITGRCLPVSGDRVAGDKIDGDKVGGDVIRGNKIVRR